MKNFAGTKRSSSRVEMVNKFVLVNYWILRFKIWVDFNSMNTIFLIGNGITSGDIWYTFYTLA